MNILSYTKNRTKIMLIICVLVMARYDKPLLGNEEVIENVVGSLVPTAASGKNLDGENN